MPMAHSLFQTRTVPRLGRGLLLCWAMLALLLAGLAPAAQASVYDGGVVVIENGLGFEQERPRDRHDHACRMPCKFKRKDHSELVADVDAPANAAIVGIMDVLAALRPSLSVSQDIASGATHLSYTRHAPLSLRDPGLRIPRAQAPPSA